MRRENHSETCINENEDNNALNIQEIIVQKPDGSLYTVADGVTALASSTYGRAMQTDFPPAKLLDGDLTSPRGLSHTGKGDNDHPWFQVDLGDSKPIASVTVVNRVDCCQCRITGTRLVITNSAAVPDSSNNDVVAAMVLPENESFGAYTLFQSVDGMPQLETVGLVSACSSKGCY